MAHDVDRAPQTVEPPRLVRPDEGLQEPRALLGRHVDGIQVDAAAPRDRDLPFEELGRRRQPVVAGELERAVAPRAGQVAVAVAVPQQVEPGRRAELEQVERPPVGDGEERRQEAPRALDLVRLDVLLGRPPREEPGLTVERVADV